MVTLVAVLQSQSVELAGTRCDPASRHSGHSGVNNAAGAEQLLPRVLMSAGGGGPGLCSFVSGVRRS